MESTETTTWFQAEYRDHGETEFVPAAKWNSHHAALHDAEALQAEMPFADVRVVPAPFCPACDLNVNACTCEFEAR